MNWMFDIIHEVKCSFKSSFEKDQVLKECQCSEEFGKYLLNEMLKLINRIICRRYEF